MKKTLVSRTRVKQSAPIATDAALTLTEIAKRISVHLTRFEHDGVINAPRPGPNGTVPYYFASAYRKSQWVGVRYISYQHLSTLTRDEALCYLKRLDEGFVGKHHEALREAIPKWPGSALRRVDARLRCRRCKRWMRFTPTKLSPAKRRQAPNAGTCTECPLPKIEHRSM